MNLWAYCNKAGGMRQDKTQKSMGNNLLRCCWLESNLPQQGVVERQGSFHQTPAGSSVFSTRCNYVASSTKMRNLYSSVNRLKKQYSDLLVSVSQGLPCMHGFAMQQPAIIDIWQQPQRGDVILCLVRWSLITAIMFLPSTLVYFAVWSTDF